MSPPRLLALPLLGAFPLTAEVVVAICDVSSLTSLDQEMENERKGCLALPRQKGDN